jgi:hypothetical protein
VRRPLLNGAAGTRRPRFAVCRRYRPGRLVCALSLAILVAAALAVPAKAGTFRVSQCRAVAGGPAARAFQADLWSVRSGSLESCGGPAGMVRVWTPNFRLAENRSVTAYLSTPARMPGTALRAAWLDWRFNGQSPSTNPAYLSVRAAGSLVMLARPGEASAVTSLELPAGARSLSFDVWCSPVNGPGWCNWPGPLLDLRGITLEAEEHGAPSATASGELLASGAHSGAEPLGIAASDADSGVREVAVTPAGTRVGTLRPAGGCLADRLPPCPQSLGGTIDVDTRAVADGAARRLRLVVTDAAGNVRTIDAGFVSVRNQPPAATPPGPPAPVSGVAQPASPTTATVRLFPTNPLAGRGHVPNGRHATEHAGVRAWLELPRRGLAPLRRRSATVPPGVRVRIRGRLTNRRGRPIGRATLAAIRRERGGRWKAITGVRTRPNGRFTAFTRIGPSQDIRFVYYAFGDSTTGHRSPRLHVTVRRE